MALTATIVALQHRRYRGGVRARRPARSPQADAARQAKKEKQERIESLRENGRYKFMKAAEERKIRLAQENNASSDSIVSNKI